MANPNFPSDGQGERVDALVSSGNAATYKLGVGSVVPTGGSTDAAWAGVATHEQGAVIGTNDGIVVVAGSSPSEDVVALAVDPGGALAMANYATSPKGLALASTIGSLGAGTYAYRVSSTTAAGETLACPQVTISVGASAGVVLTWTQVPGATGYRVYGRTSGSELFMAAVSGGALTTWTDSGSVSPSGALPTANTALVNLGNLIATGAAADGAAASGNPVLVGGSDGTNAQTLLTDTAGRVEVVGAAASGSAVAGSPVLAAGSDGTDARTLATDAGGTLLVTAMQSRRATYVASVQNVAATSASQIIVVEAPATVPVYIKRVIIWNTGQATTNAIVNFQLVRTTSAGTGGTITPARLDQSDAAFGGIVRSMPTTGGTLGTVLYYLGLDVPNAPSGLPVATLDFDGPRLGKCPVIAAGTANGIALYSPGAAGASSLVASIEFFV